MSERLLAALGMHTNSRALPLTRALEQAQVRAAKTRELRQCVVDARFRVVQPFRPCILIVGGQRRTVLCQYHAKAEASDELGIRKVLHHLANGPLTGSFGLAEQIRWDIVYSGGEFLGHFAH